MYKFSSASLSTSGIEEEILLHNSVIWSIALKIKSVLIVQIKHSVDPYISWECIEPVLSEEYLAVGNLNSNAV